MKHPLDELEVSPHPKPFVASEPTTTGEPWTAAGEVLATLSEAQARIIIDAHTAALAALAAEVQTTVTDIFKKRLAAEREKHERVERILHENPTLYNMADELVQLREQLDAAQTEMKKEVALQVEYCPICLQAYSPEVVTVKAGKRKV